MERHEFALEDAYAYNRSDPVRWIFFRFAYRGARNSRCGGHYAELYNTYFRHQSLEYMEPFGDS